MLLLNRIHRYVYSRHEITLSKCKRGQWYDVDLLMFESMFELLCLFVEDECAWSEVNDRSKYSWTDRFVISWFPRKWRRLKSRELGLRYLEMMGTEDRFDKIKELYIWYNDFYSTRVKAWDQILEPQYAFVDDHGNPTNELGLQQTTEDGKIRVKFNKLHPEYAALLEFGTELERAYDNEDDHMLRQLLDVRRHMWI